jgi:DNA-binding winged helix-turn-helix (wHTH) protein
LLQSERHETYRFFDFELDVPAYELRRGGLPVKLERQPMDLLILLVERRQQLVSRADIADHLWGKDVFVDVEHGVNAAIRKIRHALRESPEAPTCLDTVSGKGYRFIAPVEVVPGPRDRTSPALQESQTAPLANATDNQSVATKGQTRRTPSRLSASRPASWSWH